LRYKERAQLAAQALLWRAIRLLPPLDAREAGTARDFLRAAPVTFLNHRL
jgi:hypothetical protein